MDPFKTASKFNIATVIFGTLTLIFGWLITEITEPVAQLQLSVIALVFLNLFFYSLNSEKTAELEAEIKQLRDE